MDSVVHIRIGKQRKSTGVRKSTDSPYFNEYFVFEFNMTLSNLLDQQLVITILQPRKIWRRRQIVGHFNLDIATVWVATEHQFYHKWVIISAELNDKKPGPKGYLKIDVGILTKGQVPHFPVFIEPTDDDVEENLLLPENVTHDRSRANFIFYVYKAEEIPKVKNSGPSTYVQITYAGLTGKTAVKKNTQSPIWNEKIIFTELFPSLCQRIKIELQYVQNVPPIIHYLYLKSISNDGENGFLPTFGPAYIYMYTSENSVVQYNGKLLLEMKTEILTDLMWSSISVDVYPIRELPNLDLWKIEPFLLFCNIYSAIMIDKKFKDKQISFEITMGSLTSENVSTSAENTTVSMKPVPDNKQYYWYLPYNNQVTCISMLTQLNDSRRRIYNANMMKKIYYLLKVDLEKLEILFEKNYKQHKEEISSLFIKVAEKLESNCRVYLSIARMSDASKIELDEKKLKLCIKEIEEIEANVLKIVHHQGRKRIFRKLLNILYKIYNLIDDVQNCWPDVFIWMMSGNKPVGYYRLHVKHIIYSNNNEERGLFCGTIQNIFIKPTNKTKIKLTFGENSSVLCRVCVQLWFGLMTDKDRCLKKVSNSFEPIEWSEKYEIPKKFVCNEVHGAVCTVYLYQGRFEPGADQTGLSDPFVQVIFNEHMLKSNMIPNTINPVWNETLIFKNIALCGSIEFLSTNTSIVLEAYDQDMLNQTEFLGRCILVPQINLAIKCEEKQKLHWVKIYNGDRYTGELLVAAELNLLSEEQVSELDSSIIYSTVDNIPDNIKPAIKRFRLDVYFWGVHDLKKVHLQNILKPKITIECGGTTLHSTTLHNTKKYLNFQKPYQFVYVNIPDNEEYYPPLSINMFDCRGFGWYVYVGTYLAKLQDFTYQPLTICERNRKLGEFNYSDSLSTESTGSEVHELIHANTSLRSGSVDFNIDTFQFSNVYMKKRLAQMVRDTDTGEEETELIDIDIMDWWTKFYLSTENSEIYRHDRLKEKLKIKIYPCELENVEEFNHFHDLLRTFKLYRGKRTGDEVIDEENIIATFKGAIRLYQWPASGECTDTYVTETGHLVEDGSFQHYPINEVVSFITRVYVIRAFNLRPKDYSGKSDPYLCVKLGDAEVVDRENYVANETSPVFGRCFELNGSFPTDRILTIGVWDMDMSTADDFIGETTIDLENRLFTNHRGNCGLPTMYIEKGPCAWRDQYKPSQILQILCRRNKIEEPEFYEKAIKLGSRYYYTDTDLENRSEETKKEILSLIALNNWQDVPLVGCPLVPEHVETRSLYHYSKPGLEQGKLQLWVDIFPNGAFSPPPPMDVSPRKALPYELRVIIWNTDNVILEEDDFFIGEKKSDIYVKGWLTGPEDSQSTDVHYNSISGEGNFNWRFIFSFLYLSAEDKIVVRKKTSVFSADATEYNLPCYLHLQVWDNDTFSADDFLGSLKLSLSHLPRGAKSAKLCTLNNLTTDAPTINLFKTKRHKGWWPFRGCDSDNVTEILTGKVEVEIQILTEDEYRMSPAGLGRSEPQALPPPMRPDISFSWFKNPLKALTFLICHRFRTNFVIFFLMGILVFMVIVAIYSFPNYTIKRIMGA